MASGRTRDEVTATGWPAVDYEELPWVPRLDEPPASRTERRKRQGPYRAAVVAPIATAALTLPSGVAALVDDATTEITRFDAEMGPAVTPFAAILLRSESAASSRIEHLTASARAIAEAEIGVSGRRNAAEIVANTRTMTAALSLADRLDADSILQMHSALMRVVAPAAGTWRAEQVWIGGGFLGPQDADFVPPHHSRVRASIDDLVAFLDRDDLPVLAQVALAHAQFETIHPFTDGNGRTGRALAQAMLLGKRLTRSVTVPISAGLLADTESYIAALTSYRAGDPLTIVEQFAQASFRAVGNGRVLVSELRAVREEWRGAVTARRDAAVWRVLDLVLRRPVLTAQVVADELGVLPGNAARVVAPLLDAGILVQSAGRRNQVWRSPEVLSALDAFAARAGRRTPAW